MTRVNALADSKSKQLANVFTRGWLAFRSCTIESLDRSLWPGGAVAVGAAVQLSFACSSSRRLQSTAKLITFSLLFEF